MNFPLIDDIHASAAGQLDATKRLHRRFRPILEQHVRILCGRDRKISDCFHSDALIREGLRELLPTLQDGLGQLAQVATDEYNLDAAACKRVLDQFHELLVERLPAWYDDVWRQYEPRLRNYTKAVLACAPSNDPLMDQCWTDRLLGEIRRQVPYKALLRDVLTDIDYFERLLFHPAHDACVSELLIRLERKVRQWIARQHLHRKHLDDPDVNEVLGAFQVRLWERMPLTDATLSPGKPVFPRYHLWIWARDLSIDHIRRSKRRRGLHEWCNHEVFNSIPHRERNVAEYEELRAIWWANLDPRDREVMELHCCENVSTKEVARQLDVSVSTINRRLARAWKHLRQMLGMNSKGRGRRKASAMRANGHTPPTLPDLP